MRSKKKSGQPSTCPLANVVYMVVLYGFVGYDVVVSMIYLCLYCVGFGVIVCYFDSCVHLTSFDPF